MLSLFVVHDSPVDCRSGIKGSFKKMFILKKNVIFLLDIFWIYVFLYTSLQKCVECSLVVKPQNVAVLSGEDATLNCASNVLSDNIAWGSPTSSDYIYYEKVLASGISVSDKDDGNSTLHVNTSIMSMAKRYACVELTTAHEASAELIILESQVECHSQVINESVSVNCSVMYSGNWAPVLECKQWSVFEGFVVLEGSRINTPVNSMTNSTWTYTNHKTNYNIFCLIKFEESGKPSGTSATNIPKFKGAITAYYGTEKTQPLPNTSGKYMSYFMPFIVSICGNGALGIAVIILIIQRQKTNEGKQECIVHLNTANA